MSFLKKNWYFAIPAAFIALPLIMILYISLSYGYSLNEATQCFMAFGKENTKFQSLKYSEGNFDRVKPGMRGSDVFELLGIPLERHDNDTQWLYALPVGGTAYYHERTINMSGGKVTSVVKRFHSPETK